MIAWSWPSINPPTQAILSQPTEMAWINPLGSERIWKYRAIRLKLAEH